MRLSCPVINCKTDSKVVQILKDGSYSRPSDGRIIQRYRCKNCGKRFSSATFHPAFGQNKRRVNFKLWQLYSSGISMRRCAIVLNVHYITVARKVQYLSDQALKRQKEQLAKDKIATKIQFDDLITIEHTKLKPLSISVAVNEENRKILAVEVSSMPAFGTIARHSIRKYGYRKDERDKGVDSLLSQIKQYVDPRATFVTDQHQLYPSNLKKHFPNATHVTHKGARGSIYGQGELKKAIYDPLYSINHTLAMLRANVNRLIRKSWCTTKRPDMLLHHLRVYMDFHNEYLI